MKHLFILIALLGISASLYAQTQSDNSFSPMKKEEMAIQKKGMKRKGKRSSRTIFNRRMDQKVIEFEQRMDENARRNRKEKKLMAKPQYADPSYFGHKKKPKKRPLKKRKFCKECHIWH